MTKTRTCIGAGLVLLAFSGTAAADAGNLPKRAITALGVAIAAQGDAALAQIRGELAGTAKRLKPSLPRPKLADPKPAPDASVPTNR